MCVCPLPMWLGQLESSTMDEMYSELLKGYIEVLGGQHLCFEVKMCEARESVFCLLQ